MSEQQHNLKGDPQSIGMNKTNTVGIRTLNFTGNQTRTGYFNPTILKEWAELVEDVYGTESTVEVVFTPDAPLAARVPSDVEIPNPETIGVAAAPRIESDSNE